MTRWIVSSETHISRAHDCHAQLLHNRNRDRRIKNLSDVASVISMEPAWLAIKDVLERDPSILLRLSDRQWEEIVAASYARAGYDEVILTPRSGDLERLTTRLASSPRLVVLLYCLRRSA